MKLIILDEAKDEVREAFEWYAARSSQAAERFADLVADAVAEIAAFPERYPLYEIRRNPGNVRRIRLTGYPYVIVYELTTDLIKVLAVAHTSQRPGYWRSRVKGKPPPTNG